MHGTTDSVPRMGQNADSMYKFDGSFDDITGSEYAVGSDVDTSWIAGTVVKAQLDADAAREAFETVRLQAIAALRERGLSVREIAQVLHYGSVSRSQVSRAARTRPQRFAPQPAIDALVERAWQQGPKDEWERPAEREGDHPRRLNIAINILGSVATLRRPITADNGKDAERGV
jgi:hypothetical protein